MMTRLDAWIKRIRSTDPMTFEDAYFGDRPQGPEVLDRLIRELHASADGYTRGKFCELLGEMGDTSTIAVLAPELNHPDERVRLSLVSAHERRHRRLWDGRRPRGKRHAPPPGRAR